MRRRADHVRRRAEPTIALINIVFLMLIFFMVAGTLAPPVARDVTLVQTQDLAGRAPPDALVLDAGGVLRFRGRELADVALYLADLDPPKIARIVPDRAAPADRLIAVGRDLAEAGARRILIVTEQALP